MRHHGVHMDLVHNDLNIRYLLNGLWQSQLKIRQDQFGNIDYLKFGPSWPKNNRWGLKMWQKKNLAFIESYFKEFGMPEIVHAHTYLGAILASAMSTRHRIPFVVTTHYTGWLDGRIRPLHQKMAEEAFSKARKVFAVSKTLAHHISSSTSLEVEVMPNFVNTDLFLFGNIEKKHILCVGDLIPRKQYDHAITAFSNIAKEKKGIQLVIIGNGPEYKKLVNLTHSLGIHDRVRFTGALEHSEVSQYMKSALLLLHPSRMETFGLTPVEALCCGTPVISYANGGVEMMSHLDGIHICEDANAGCMSDKLRTVLANPIGGISIAKRAKASFGKDVIIPKYIEEYKRLLV